MKIFLYYPCCKVTCRQKITSNNGYFNWTSCEGLLTFIWRMTATCDRLPMMLLQLEKKMKSVKISMLCSWLKGTYGSYCPVRSQTLQALTSAEQVHRHSSLKVLSGLLVLKIAFTYLMPINLYWSISLSIYSFKIFSFVYSFHVFFFFFFLSKQYLEIDFNDQPVKKHLQIESGILVWARGTMSSNVASNTCKLTQFSWWDAQ